MSEDALLRRRLAEWIIDPGDGSMMLAPSGEMRYGYAVAKAEVRSILRDPSGEHSTETPSPEEIEAYAAFIESTDSGSDDVSNEATETPDRAQDA